MLTSFRPGQAHWHIENAQSLERQGRLDEAMHELKRAVEADPSNPSAHNALGQHYLRKGLTTKAADEFHSAALLRPDLESFFNLGRTLIELERYQEASEAFRQCLGLADDDPSVRFELAYTQCAQGECREALAEFEALAREYPGDWELYAAIAECQIGLCNYTQALEAIQQALRDAPQNADLTSLKETHRYLQRRLEFSPQHPLGVRDRLYVDHGILCLGNSHDDGVDIAVHHGESLSIHDVAVSLSRLSALVRQFQWVFHGLVATERSGEMLLPALAQLLQLPQLDLNNVRSDQRVILVVGSACSQALVEATVRRIQGQAVCFSPTLSASLDQDSFPDIVGAVCREQCALPFDGLPELTAPLVANAVIQAIELAPPDPCLSIQAEYYSQHRRLRFLRHFSALDPLPV